MVLTVKRLGEVLHIVLHAALGCALALRAHWRLVLLWAGMGALLGGLVGVLRPERYRATAVVSLEPAVFNLSTVLATGGLVRNYALELESELYLARVAERLGWPEPPHVLARSVRARPAPEALTITVEVLAPSRRRAVTLANGLVGAFQEDVEAANLARARADRLRVGVVTPAYVAVPDTPSPLAHVWAGGLLGFAAGWLAVALRAWWFRDRVRSPQEAERLLQAPTLGVIPQ